MPPKISVIITTRNRAEVLPSVLQSLTRQTLSADRFEVIVVDNGSTDGTSDLLKSWKGSSMTVHSVWEPIAGISRGRNAGARLAQGTFLAFLDDDVVALPDWLRTILQIFETVRPRPGCVGGIVATEWGAVRRPRWLTDELSGCIPMSDGGPKPQWLTDGRYNWEANIAFPRSLFLSLGGFPVHLGRQGAIPLANEGHLLQLRLWQKGYGSYYDPRIIVHHRLDAGRLHRRCALRQCFWLGISERIVAEEHHSAPILRFRWMLFRKYLKALHPFVLVCSAAWACGYVFGRSVCGVRLPSCPKVTKEMPLVEAPQCSAAHGELLS